MGVSRRENQSTMFLQIKHYCLWQEFKTAVPGSEPIEVTNPKTGVKSTKHGKRYDSIEGRVVDMVKYDTAKQYPTRYFGFKMHILDGADKFVIDLPYNSQGLRRFLKVAPLIDFAKPLTITVFKGKKEGGGEELAVWFRQNGETIKNYYTKENPRGMPQPKFYPDAEQQWDFRDQHSWLIERLKFDIIPQIKAAAVHAMPPATEYDDQPEPQYSDNHGEPPPHSEHITDEDVPF